MPMPSRKSRSAPSKFPLIVFLALCGVLFQANICAEVEGSTIAKGTWGGEHILLEVSEKGAEVEFDCAHGEIKQPITLDKHGDFDISGTFTPEHGGPVRRDENTTPAPARYSGHVDGETLNLTITLAKAKVGTFTLTHNSHPNLMKCR
jgi:hypothetical protein